MRDPKKNAKQVSRNPFRPTELGISDTIVAPDITEYENPAPVAEHPPARNGSVERPEARTGADAAPARIRGDIPAPTTSVLEQRHPEIAKAISLLWGFPEMNQYFERLWLAEGAHGPIDPQAMTELMLLSRIHQMIVPQRPGRSLADVFGSSRLYGSPVTRDPWADIPERR